MGSAATHVSLFEFIPLRGAFDGFVDQDDAVEHGTGRAAAAVRKTCAKRAVVFGDFDALGEILAGAECGAHRCAARFVALIVTRSTYGRGSVGGDRTDQTRTVGNLYREDRDAASTPVLIRTVNGLTIVRVQSSKLTAFV